MTLEWYYDLFKFSSVVSSLMLVSLALGAVVAKKGKDCVYEVILAVLGVVCLLLLVKYWMMN